MTSFSMLKSLTLGLLVLFSAVGRLLASNCPISVNPELRTVSWGELGPVDGNHHTLISDDAQKTFDAPHYTPVPWGPAREIRRFPTAYTKGSIPAVQMDFFLDVHIPEEHKGECKLMVRAMRDGKVYLPEQEFTLLDGPNTYTYGWKLANEAFPNQIRFYGPGIGTFALGWQYKLGNGEYQAFHTSNHRIYLTAAKPQCKRGNRETLFYYGCHQPNGMSGDPGNEDAVTKKIYNDFMGLRMKRINHGTGLLDGTVLYYYQDPPPPTTTGELLVDGTAVCGGWARFFADVLHVHDYTPEIVNLSQTKHGFGGWWIKGLPPQMGRSTVGQGPGNSNNGWGAHSITKAYNNYYDPSYGIGPCPSEVNYEDSAVGSYYYQDPLEYPDKPRTLGAPYELNYKPVAY